MKPIGLLSSIHTRENSICQNTAAHTPPNVWRNTCSKVLRAFAKQRPKKTEKDRESSQRSPPAEAASRLQEATEPATAGQAVSGRCGTLGLAVVRVRDPDKEHLQRPKQLTLRSVPVLQAACSGVRGLCC